MTIRRGPVATDRLTAIEGTAARTNERTNAMKNTGAAAESGEGLPERRDEGTAHQLDFHDDAERTTPTFSPARTNVDADAQGTPSTMDTTMDTPGSKANVDFWNRFVLPSTADVKEMSPREADEVLSELGRAMSEACARGGCDHIGELLVAMPKQNLKKIGNLLLELARAK
jgi:hypothetical protein